MRKTFLIMVAATALGSFAQTAADSLDVLACAPANGAGGLQLAWRANSSQPWQTVNFTNLSSDFGPWGSHKKMFGPMLTYNPGKGLWTCSWVADSDGYVLASASTKDFKRWSAQHYEMSTADRPGVGQYSLEGRTVYGNVVRMHKSVIDGWKEYAALKSNQAKLYKETMASDPERFAALAGQTPAYTVKARPKGKKDISDMLIGIFFEDINYAADGGLYGELVQNRDFEYLPSDSKEHWTALTAWNFPEEAKGTHKVLTSDPIHPNNPHYLQATANAAGYAIENEGYDGIALVPGQYDLSIKAKGSAPLKAKLVSDDGLELAATDINVSSGGWADYGATLSVGENADKCRLRIEFAAPGEACLDMVSLFPQATFKGRKNGLRADMAQVLADLHPRFVRFPGGCVAHGNGIDNIYDWKGSIGKLEERKPLRNIWGYHQTRGLGYFEFFQFCEDIGAEPLPVLAAGVPCQNSGIKSKCSHDKVTSLGQQGGIPMEEMGAYVQDVLDLIEYANGPATSTWGAKRAAAGHPEPFNLKYIGIGNEDMITEVFEPRFKMINDAVRKTYPDIKVVGTAGPFYEGTDYERGWEIAREQQLPLIDEHYYVDPAWLIYNRNFYDSYDRKGTKVYLGEWAAHLPGRPSNVETALAEALYLTDVERNADVVAMTSYAPLLAKDGHTQWRPDLIYFGNTDIRPTVDYYVQQLYGQNSGDKYVPAESSLSVNDDKARARVGSSIVIDSASGDVIVKLANLLPCEVAANLDLSGLGIKKDKPQAVCISGAPADSKATPQPTDVKSLRSGKLAHTLPPYSFTVIRFSTK